MMRFLWLFTDDWEKRLFGQRLSSTKLLDLTYSPYILLGVQPLLVFHHSFQFCIWEQLYPPLSQLYIRTAGRWLVDHVADTSRGDKSLNNLKFDLKGSAPLFPSRTNAMCPFVMPPPISTIQKATQGHSSARHNTAELCQSHKAAGVGKYPLPSGTQRLSVRTNSLAYTVWDKEIPTSWLLI